ncbi:Uncharacterized protein FKW44_016744 [Caligus rogercresseyi]|uniref:Uncharacterized protein n=1 Tax=Caligus rogercresseyi TaxID=217165 RepID=A0A7T8H345_CALRO|nr:Uncharacterized protein FKW44_016744 [Caligus rogercresseyi]
MEEEKKAMRCSLPSVPGGVQRVVVNDQWKAGTLFKDDAHREKAFSVPGGTRTDEFVAEVKRKVNEDGNKSYAKLAAEMGCSKQPWMDLVANGRPYVFHQTRLPPTSRGRPGVAVGEPPLPLEPGLVAPQLP